MAEQPSYQVKTRSQMKTISVIFVADDLVGDIICSRKEHERLMRQKQKQETDKLKSLKDEDGEHVEVEGKEKLRAKKRKHDDNDDISRAKPKRTKYVDDVELALAALENDDVEKVDVNQPTTLFDDQGDVSANKLCHFENLNNTPKAKNNFKSCLKSPVTPKSKTVSFSNKENNTPKNKNHLATISEEADHATTPYSLRRKVIKDIKKIQKILENSDDDDFSGSESEYSAESSSEASSEGDEETKPVRRRHFNHGVASDDYFEAQSAKKAVTSNNTLKKLRTPKLTQEQLDELHTSYTASAEHRTRLKQLVRDQLALFHKWDFILHQNYNLLLYGLGSKKEVVNQFLKRYVERHPVIVVNGFFPSVTLKEITDKLSGILKIEADSNDVVDRIAAKIKDYDVEIYLAVNNIDGMMLRNKKCQTALSRLSKVEQIHVVATVDHINAPLIWDKSVLSDYNWVWFDSTTYRNYKEEVVYEGNIMLHNSGQLTLSSLRNVFNSLTSNSKGIFMVVLRDQLSRKTLTGISFRELYQECRKELLISSDVALRSQLKEFLDHLILKQKRSQEGEERFVISIDNSILKQFLDEQEPS